MELTPTGRWLSSAWVVATFCILTPIGSAQERDQPGDPTLATYADQDTVEAVDYPAAFFARYAPNTALDMVNEVPGFQLDDGDATRGFASATGNILINDRRPSAKQDLPSAILERIPASQVERIELIRGQVRDIDLQGRSVVANVILKDVAKAAVRWRGSLRYNVEFGLTSEGEISVSDRWREVDYNAGIQLRDYVRGDHTPMDVLDGNGDLIETRFDVGDFDGLRGSANFNAATQLGANSVRFNARIGSDQRDGQRLSDRTPQAPGTLPSEELFLEDFESFDVEVGIDAERNLGPELIGKAILIHTDGDEDVISSQLSFDDTGLLTRERISDTDTQTNETIARVEFVWGGWDGHVVQASLEGAFNSLDNVLVQTVDTGTGPVIVDVPNSDSRVEETRGDLLLKDTWTIGPYKFEYGLGAEVSTISQTGDARQERSFTFVKPQLGFTFAPHQGNQTRIRIGREVSQLDFNDFVSATVFEDDDLALGNPDLQPETTWRLELGHERRFGKDSVVIVTVFHDWVSDVEDLLPLSPIFEAPGNIGDGRRWGIEFEGTIPLDRMRLAGAKLDIYARWQDSGVADPVTGADRIFSVRNPPGRLLPLNIDIDNEYAITVDFRQDFEEARWAWGSDVRARAERPEFKVNELDISDDETEFNIFIETTRWLGLKLRLSAENILDIAETRDRTLYVGERGLSPVDRRELRSRERGFRVLFEISGSF